MTVSSTRIRELLTYDPADGLFRWRESVGSRARAGDVAGSTDATGYVQIVLDGVKYFAHRLVWLHQFGDWPSDQIDHVNGLRSDNRLCNLRNATRSQNLANQGPRKDNSSGFKGVSFSARKAKWRAYIRQGGKQCHLGYFHSSDEAHVAYSRAAVATFGDFARVS